MKICIVYGTRPEYLKVLPLFRTIKCTKIRVTQHGDILEDMIYDRLLEIKDTCSNRLDSVGTQILNNMGPIIQDCTHVLVQGDTATAFYSALCAFQNQKIIIHLEAGLRTYDITKPYPEEAYRQMISRLTTIHLCPHESNAILLRNEHVSGDIHVVGNTILDVVKSYNLTVKKGNDVIITFHRRENLQYLDSFVKQLNDLMYENPTINFIWIMHPNKELQYLVQSSGTTIRCVNPCSHFEFLQYVKDSYCVITDSGGIQEECAFLGKPVIVLREHTERDQIKQPYLYIVKPPYLSLKTTFQTLPQSQLLSCDVYGKGDSAIKISEILRIQ